MKEANVPFVRPIPRQTANTRFFLAYLFVFFWPLWPQAASFPLSMAGSPWLQPGGCRRRITGKAKWWQGRIQGLARQHPRASWLCKNTKHGAGRANLMRDIPTAASCSHWLFGGTTWPVTPSPLNNEWWPPWPVESALCPIAVPSYIWVGHPSRWRQCVWCEASDQTASGRASPVLPTSSTVMGGRGEEWGAGASAQRERVQHRTRSFTTASMFLKPGIPRKEPCTAA
jgi:hypothetical protein